MSAIGDQLVNTGAILTVPISATDPDGDTVIFSSPDLPPFAELTNLGGNEAELRLMPLTGDVGTVSLSIEATDDDAEPLTVSETISVQVDPPIPNRPPVFAPVSDVSITPDTLTVIPLAASDLDGDELTFSGCLLYTSPSPRDLSTSRMPSSA